jgi:hypothetical protein
LSDELIKFALCNKKNSTCTTKIPSFSNWISNQKVPQSDKGSKNYFVFLGQVDFKKSYTIKMVFLTNLKVVLLTNPKAVVLIKNFD